MGRDSPGFPGGVGAPAGLELLSDVLGDREADLREAGERVGSGDGKCFETDVPGVVQGSGADPTDSFQIGERK